MEALTDDNMEVRNSAAMFLGWIESKEAIPALLQVAAADSNLRVRKSALQALENIRDAGAVLPLIRLLNDDSKDIREKVLVTLERITGETLAISNGDEAKDRLADVNRLKEWWIKKKHDITNGDERSAAERGAVAEMALETGSPGNCLSKLAWRKSRSPVKKSFIGSIRVERKRRAIICREKGKGLGFQWTLTPA